MNRIMPRSYTLNFFRYTAFLTGFLTFAPAAQAQFSWVFYAGRFGTSTADTTRGTIYQINSTTGAESTGVNLLNFSLFSSQTFQGTNGLAYDRATDRVYFSLTSGSATDGRGTLVAGDLGIYYWQRHTNTVGQLMSFSGLTTPDQNSGGTAITRQLGSDNAFIYNGYYYFLQDQAVDSTPDLYRISLTAGTPTVETLQDFNGTNARSYYDFGDIAVSSGGVLYGSAGDGRSGTRSNWWFSSNISGSNASTMSSTGYTETTPATTQESYQLAYGWQNDTTLSTTIYGQNSNGSAGGNGDFSAINTTTGANGTAIFTGARIYSDLTSAPILLPEPGSLLMLCLGGLGLPLLRRRPRSHPS